MATAHSCSTWKLRIAFSSSTPRPRSEPNHSPSTAPDTAAGAAMRSPSMTLGIALGTCSRLKRLICDEPRTEKTSWVDCDPLAKPDPVATRIVKNTNIRAKRTGVCWVKPKALMTGPSAMAGTACTTTEPVYVAVSRRGISNANTARQTASAAPSR